MTAPKRSHADLADLPRAQLERMLAAGEEIAECYRVLRKAGLNVVGEVLKGQGPFYEMNHYPKDDVYDGETHAQYYYHAHRPNEHGHFHTFVRRPGMPAEMQPVPDAATRDWPAGDATIAHIVAISMNAEGYPIGLFTANRWVTGDTWYAADDVLVLLDRFVVDHAYPSWPTNRWITAMLRLFRPQIEALVRGRDERLRAWADAHPDSDVYEDRRLETLSETRVNVEKQMAAVRRALAARA